MSDPIQIAMDRLMPIFKVVDEVLGEWSKDVKSEGCLQFPVLMGMLAVKTSWTDEEARKNDPFIRWYVRNHSEWHVTRGARGGIMKAEDKQKKEAVRLAKIAAKADMKAALEAELAEKKSSEIVSPEIDSDLDSE